MSGDLVSAADGPGEHVVVTPDSAGWRFLSFSIIALDDAQVHTDLRAEEETAIVPLSGSATIEVGGETFEVQRSSVFEQMTKVVYSPPNTAMTITANGAFEFAIGSAPAEGKYPVRMFSPAEMKSEVRGGGAARRQVNHVLAPPLPAERLILYEVYVPRGTWSGWPPHRHDGIEGSPYLEETYLFRLDPSDGFALHRNWAPETGFDEVLVAQDSDVALVPRGYHSSVACPGAHMYFLNYLAGDLVDEKRTTPPCFHQSFTWIEDDWDAHGWDLPVTAP